MTAPVTAGPGPVLVVGDLLVDVIAVHDGPAVPGSDRDARIRFAGGGSAANTAHWLTRHGERPRLLAAVGDDAPGRWAVEELQAAGVAFVGPTVAAASGCCVVLVDGSGERTMLPDRGANDHLDPAAVADAAWPAPSWLHLSGYTLLHAGSRAGGLAALALGRSAGAVVSVDASSTGPIELVGPDVFLGWIDGVDVVFANDAEVAVLGGRTAVLGHAGSLVTKHGAGGASWSDGGEAIHVAAPDVPVADSTGAGDAFAAAWIAASRRQAPTEDRLASAVQAGSAAVAVPGGRPPMGDR